MEIADALSVKLKTIVSEDYVRLTLHELNRDGLLENSDEIRAYLNGINRREMVKKIGFASMIAMPLVSSVIAPTAGQAASDCLACFGTGFAPSACLPPPDPSIGTIAACRSYCGSICCNGVVGFGFSFLCSCDIVNCA